MEESIVAMQVELKPNGIKAMSDGTYDVTFKFAEPDLEAVQDLMKQKAINPIGKLVFVPDNIDFSSE